MFDFAALFTDSKLESYGVNLDTWTRADQSLLRETMILVGKESPEMTQEEAETKCKEHVEDILFEKFVKRYKFVLRQLELDHDSAYETFEKLGSEDPFDAYLEREIEYAAFATRFYSDLREMWNADTVLVREQFEKMKTNKWSFSQYSAYLKERRREMRKR
jgi:hypothetical protein